LRVHDGEIHDDYEQLMFYFQLISLLSQLLLLPWLPFPLLLLLPLLAFKLLKLPTQLFKLVRPFPLISSRLLLQLLLPLQLLFINPIPIRFLFIFILFVI